MPANIMFTDGMPNFAQRGEAAWWGKGEALDGDDGLATTAVRKARIAFPVYREQLYYRHEGVEYPTNNIAILRPGLEGEGVDTVQLGVAGKEYMPITNYRVAELLDKLTQPSDTHPGWPCNTAGALGKGEDFFLTLDAGRAEIAGDEMRQYFFAWNKHDGSGALRFMFTPIRVVCQNTCLIGAQKANVTTSVIHNRNVEAEAEFAVDLTVRLQKAQQDSMFDLGLFPKLTLSAAEVKRIIVACYPERDYNDDPTTLLSAKADDVMTLTDDQVAKLYGVKMRREQAVVKTREMRAAAGLEFKKLLDERGQYAWSAWLLYQAITAMSSHNGKGADTLKGLNIMTGGDRAKPIVTAYTLITDLPEFKAIRQDALAAVR